MTDGVMAIASQRVVGTSSSYSGNIRTGETYAGNQSSQLSLTATQLSDAQWIGVGVRAQPGGQSLYLGIYWWNNGNPVLMLFERNNGTFTQLGATYPSGPLPAGTLLRLAVTGSTLTLSQNGVTRITASDTTLTGGRPAIIAFGTPAADNWQGTGNTSTAPTYTIGGTISGLSGTVVLQNNGGDTLTRSTNGSFTFATRLPGGTPYSVTVVTNPSGQTCAVANGSGTINTANITNVNVTCTAALPTVSDDFNRADGALGPNWTAMNDGAMAIASQAVIGTNAAYSGNIRTGEVYAANQSSQLGVATQLTGGQWIGVGVRAQPGGQSLYLGLYWWNNGNPVLMLFERNNGTFTQLGPTYASGPLPAGTVLKLTAAGSTLTFSQNGVTRITASDDTLNGGSPAIMAFGTAAADDWKATGSPGLSVQFVSTDANGVET
jgi:hypothetical protein